MVVPFIAGLFLSLFNYEAGGIVDYNNFVGIKNYIRLFQDTTFIRSLGNTIKFALFATMGDLFIGTLIAVYLNKQRFRIGNALRAVFLMPLLISPIITGLIWRYMYDPSSGLVYVILGYLGVTIDKFPGIASPDTAMLCIVIAHCWQTIPFVILVVTAGLVSIPLDMYEAAYLEGAGNVRTFFSISLPLLRDMYMVILIVSGVDTIKVFDIIYAITQGGPANSTISMSIYAYQSGFKMYQMGYAMAISMAIMVLSFLLFGYPFIRFSDGKAQV